MNAVLDVLKLRRAILDYVTPPICPGISIASGSGSGSGTSFLESDEGGPPPVIRLEGQCDAFTLWDKHDAVIGMAIYSSKIAEGPFSLLAEFIPTGSVQVCSQGSWQATGIDADGGESERSVPIICDGNTPVLVGIPGGSSIVSFRLYRDGSLKLVSSIDDGLGACEVCENFIYLRAQAITEEGVSNFSNMVERVITKDCCGPAKDCPPGSKWNPVKCSCDKTPSDIEAVLPSVCVGTGSKFLGTFTMTGPTITPPVTWSITGSIPAGLTFHDGEQPGQATTLDGIPLVGGDFHITVSAMDSQGVSSSRNFVVTNLVVASPMPTGTTDVPYLQDITTTGGQPPFTDVVISGALPKGLTLTTPDSGGVWSVAGTALTPTKSPVTIQVSDSAGAVCTTTLEIDPCPQNPILASIPAWDTFPAAAYLTFTYDPDRRMIWVPSAVAFPSAPYAQVALVDTATGTFAGYASDPNNFTNTAAKGNYSNYIRGVIDSNNSQFVIGGRISSNFMTFFDLDTTEVVACIPYTSNEPGYGEATYDSRRGYIYIGVYPIGNQSITVLDCNRNARGVIGNYPAAGGIKGGHIVYCPDNDLVYVGNGGGGTHLFYTWDPNTMAYNYTAGPLGVSGTNNSMFYLPGLHLIAVGTAGLLQFFDPNQGNALVGSATYGGVGAPMFQMVDNTCKSVISTSQYGVVGVAAIDPKNGFAITPIPGLSHRSGDLAFDSAGNKLFVYDNDTRGIDAA